MLFALHGFTESDEVWEDVLQDSGISYASILLPGHGSKPCQDEQSISSVAADIAASMPQDEAVDLLGYSMGGRIALRLALDHPERVKRLILVSSCPGLKSEPMRSERCKHDDALAEILEQDGIGAFVAWWENNPALKTARNNNLTAEATLRSRRLNHDPDDLAHACRALGQGRMEPLWDRLPELQCPCLLISGSHDLTYKALAKEAAGLIPHSRLRVVPVSGHAIHREQPDAFMETLLDFLQEDV
ncbi:MAG: alpha/beta fold hydrolase [Planctomycetes bacterium]|nr:alpha/beta fold hydrolase [Planctomycetota bacterium]